MGGIPSASYVFNYMLNVLQLPPFPAADHILDYCSSLAVSAGPCPGPTCANFAVTSLVQEVTAPSASWNGRCS